MSARDELRDCFLSDSRDRFEAAADAFRAEVLAEAIEAARSEYLTDNTGTPEDEAYNQAITDAVAAIGALLETAASSGPAAGDKPSWMCDPAPEGTAQCGETHRPSGAGACVLPAGHGGRVHQDRHTNQWPAAGDKQPETEACQCKQDRDGNGEGWIQYRARDGEFVELRCRDHKGGA